MDGIYYTFIILLILTILCILAAADVIVKTALGGKVVASFFAILFGFGTILTGFVAKDTLLKK